MKTVAAAGGLALMVGIAIQPVQALGDPLVPVTISPSQGALDATVRVSVPACSAGTVVRELVFGDRERTPADPVRPGQLYPGPAQTYRRVGLGDPLPGLPDAYTGLPTPFEVDVNLGAADPYRSYTPSPGESLKLWIGCFTPNTDGTTYGMATTGTFTVVAPSPTPSPNPTSSPNPDTPAADLIEGSVIKLPARQRFGKAKYVSTTPKVCKIEDARKVRALSEGTCVIKAKSVKKGKKKAVRIKYTVAAA